MTSQEQGSRPRSIWPVDDPRYFLGQSIVELVERAQLHHTCLTCEHFDEAREICRVADARPPARVIASGCPSYTEEIPF